MPETKDTPAKPASKPATADRAKVDAALVDAQHEASLALEAQHDAKVARQNAKFEELGDQMDIGNRAKELGATVKGNQGRP